MRQLCDTACKALSPAVNDPYTAIQAGEHLAVLFAALAGDPALAVAAAVTYGLAYTLELGLSLVFYFGAGATR
jgi:uncharacterized membrane protein